MMQKYVGSCHCGSIKFEFHENEITKGVYCNCSICKRKGALMSAFTISPDKISIDVVGDALATYSFGSKVAKQHFCKNCGIYTFHQTRIKPGYYRVNLGCIEGINTNTLSTEIYDGASI